MKKVLIVDDVKGWRDFNSNAVDEFYNGEVEITTADCAQKAYDLLLENRNQPFDVICRWKAHTHLKWLASGLLNKLRLIIVI